MSGKELFQQRRKLILIAGIVVVAVVAALLIVKFMTGGAGEGKLYQMPELIGIQEPDARSALEATGIIVEIEDVLISDESDYKPGQVIEQIPVAGAEIRAGETVILKVAKLDDVSEVVPPTDAFTGETPDIVGMTQSSAASAITTAGYIVGTVTQADSELPAGTVVSQSPAKGTKLEKDGKIDFVVSKGPAAANLVKVPDLSKWTKTQANDAKAALTSVKLQYAFVESYKEGTQAGWFLSQSPAAGQQVTEGSIVTITYSKGVDPKGSIKVPDLSKWTKAQASEAQSALTKLNLKYAYKEVYKAGTQPGWFLSQSPAKDTLVQPNSTVTITYSKGEEPVVAQVKVPSFTKGMNIADYVAKLDALGLHGTPASASAYDPDGGAAGSGVVRVSPSAGTLVAKGSTVTVYVNIAAPPPPPTPTVISVSVNPGSYTLNPSAGGPQTYNGLFSAAVQVSGGASQAVTWSISPNTGVSIDPSTGAVTINSNAPQGVLTVTATSVDDPTKFGSAQLTIGAPAP